jgi:hypothetical protein
VVDKSVALCVAAALAEIGGAHLVWTAVKAGRGLLVGVLGELSLAHYSVVAASHPETSSGAYSPPTAACSSPSQSPSGMAAPAAGRMPASRAAPRRLHSERHAEAQVYRSFSTKGAVSGATADASLATELDETRQ